MENIDILYQKFNKLVNKKALKNRRGMQNYLKIHFNEIYSKAIAAYDSYLGYVSKLVSEIALKGNSISSSIVIEKLITSGYLSINNTFASIMLSEYLFDITPANGIDIINGFGCCRSKSDIHHRIFKLLNYFDDEFPCQITDEDDLTVDQKILAPGNHLCNLIRYDGIYYVRDCQYNGIFRFLDALSLEPYMPYQYLKDKKIIYKIADDVVLNGLYLEEIRKKLEEFDETSKKVPITLNELNEIIMETENCFNKSINMIEDFSASTNDKKLEIISLAKERR